MIRRILCDKCGSAWKPHPQDAREGWIYRTARLTVKKPATHNVEMWTGDVLGVGGVPLKKVKVMPLESIMCDTCGSPIADGELATAVSMTKDSEFPEWEHEYGTLLSEAAYQAAKTLAKP